MKQMVTSLFGMFGSAVALLFGGWDIALQTLVLFMGIDWITGGILLPVIFKKSPKSENGISHCRHWFFLWESTGSQAGFFCR